MSETITLMKSHTSVRRFKEEAIPQEDLNEILSAAQMASSWKNFQSYSVILVRSQEKKDALFELVPQEAIRQSAAFLLFVGDLNRAEKGARLHTDTFQPQGVEGLLITSVDAALAGQNTLLAAESLGYGGVIIGLVRYKSVEVAELFKLPDYTYPVFGIALGMTVCRLNMQELVRLPLGVNVLQSNSVSLNQAQLEKILNKRTYYRK